jgi:hypothetical protein
VNLPPSKESVTKLVVNPSLGALTYQACFLIEELHAIARGNYPKPAREIRNVLLCWTDYVLDQLWELYDPKDPLGIKEGGDFDRVRELGRILRNLYAAVRYLHGSAPEKSPPALQFALNELTKLHFPRSQGNYACIVRPQWKYNLKYVPLSDHLKDISALTVLDPDARLGVDSEEQILDALWQRMRSKLKRSEKRSFGKKPPKHLAILSFAGLDTEDTLLYPLLAHELGHFIDFSYQPPLHYQGRLRNNARISESQVRAIVKKFSRQTEFQSPKRIWNIISEYTFVCLRELLADILATRMMGLAFFTSQAEFLKTVADWNQPTIDLASGYPSIKLRLSVIYHHLIADDRSKSLVAFVRELAQEQSEIRNFILSYFEEWGRVLKTPETILRAPSKTITSNMERKLSRLIGMAILNSLSELNEVARTAIPDRNRVRFSDQFIERIRLLQNRRAPICTESPRHSFAEIMSAAWVYQLMEGEWREIKKRDIRSQKKIYRQTCQLVLDAIGADRNRDSR